MIHPPYTRDFDTSISAPAEQIRTRKEEEKTMFVVRRWGTNQRETGNCLSFTYLITDDVNETFSFWKPWLLICSKNKRFRSFCFQLRRLFTAFKVGRWNAEWRTERYTGVRYRIRCCVFESSTFESITGFSSKWREKFCVCLFFGMKRTRLFLKFGLSTTTNTV